MSDSASLTREDLLLLLIDGADGRYPADPVRLMKGAFLVVERGRPAWKRLFHFQAYDYGPFDRGVYDARDSLIRDGLIDVRHGRYEQYALTPDGQEHARALRRDFAHDAEWIRRIGHHVSTRSFSSLLEEIYSAYPAYRSRSIFRS